MTAAIRLSATVLALSGAAFTALALGTSSPGTFVERAHGLALDGTPAQRPSPLGLASGGVDASHLHLSSAPRPATVATNVTVGDTIAIGSRDGRSVSYEVIEIAPLAATALAGSKTLVMVTAVSVGLDEPQTMRFLVERNTTQPSAPTASRPHAL